GGWLWDRDSSGHADGRPTFGTQGIDTHWPPNVLELLLAQILEPVIELVAHLIAHHPADADPAGLGQSLQPRGHVHPIPKDVVFLSNHIAEVDPRPELDPLIGRDGAVSLGHPPLDLDSASDGIDDAAKFRQKAVAGVFDNAPAVFGD